MKDLYKRLISETKNFCFSRKFNSAVVGVSGGIDSALTLKIAVDALEKENVSAIFLPHKNMTSNLSSKLAKKISDFCGTKLIIQEISKFNELAKKLPWIPNKTADSNFSARVRMIIIYHLANSRNALVFGTCNKTEIMTGYFTKYGDGASDVEILGNLYKTQVFEIAKEVGIPSEIIDRTPTAELYENQTDEEDLGGKYEDIDKIIQKFINGLNPKNNFEKQIFSRIRNNEHKRNLIPIINVQ